MRLIGEVPVKWTTKSPPKSKPLRIQSANFFLMEINAIETEKRNNKNSEINLHSSSHQALSPGNSIHKMYIFDVLILAQLFGVMPIFGIRTKDASGLKFNWINYRVFVFVVLSILWAASSDLSMKRIEPIIWFLSKLVIILYFINLASKWPDLMQYWQNIEKNVPTYKSDKRNWIFYNEIKFYTVTISVLIFVEHSMSIAAGVYRGRLCTNTTNVEAYFHQAFPQVYSVTEYSGGWKEFLVELLNYYCVFLWSFMDIFIVGISKCLSTRLNQFNELVHILSM